MRATLDVLDEVEFIQQEKRGSAQSSPTALTIPGRTAVPALPRRQRNERWKSSLDPQDLACLLSILESSLIPRLLNGYSPADSTPLSGTDQTEG